MRMSFIIKVVILLVAVLVMMVINYYTLKDPNQLLITEIEIMVIFFLAAFLLYLED